MNRLLRFFLVMSLGAGCFLQPPIQKSVPAPKSSPAPLVFHNNKIVVVDNRKEFLMAMTEHINAQLRPMDAWIDTVSITRPDDNPSIADIGHIGAQTDQGYILRINTSHITAATHLQVVSTFAHESGHMVFDLNDGTANHPDYQSITLRHYNRMNLAEIQYFKDDNFVHDGSGHPQDNSGELFASTYALASLVKNGFINSEDVRPIGKGKAFWRWVRTLPLLDLQIAQERACWDRKPTVFAKKE